MRQHVPCHRSATACRMRRGRTTARRAQAAVTIGCGNETGARSKEAKKKQRACVSIARSSLPATHRAKPTKPTFFLRFGAIWSAAHCAAGMFQKRNAQARPARRMPCWRHPARSSGKYPTRIGPLRRRPPRYRPIFQFHDAGNLAVGHLKYPSKISRRALFQIVISRNILRAHPFLVPMRGCLDASVTVRPFPRLFYGRGYRTRAPARPSLLIQNQNNFDRMRLFPQK